LYLYPAENAFPLKKTLFPLPEPKSKSRGDLVNAGAFTFIKKEDITQAEKDAIDKIIIPDKPVKKPSEKQ
jgi:hypothetical protein